MDKYISKQDMLNAVEKLDIIPSVDGMGIPTGAEDFRVQFLGTVLKVKPADVAHVIHCRNCKYFRVHKCMDSMPIEICDLDQTFYDPDRDFCSLAESREG